MSLWTILTGGRRAFHVLHRRLRWAPLLMIVSLAPAGALAQATRPLPPFNVNIAQSSVSGLSSGGYMAMQFEVAFSSILKGAGVVAGGPYYCAQGNQTTATSVCSCVPAGCDRTRTTNVPDLIRITDQNAAQGLIDATSNLRNGRFWLFSGTADTAVPQRIMNELKTYLLNYVDSGTIFYKKISRQSTPSQLTLSAIGVICEMTPSSIIAITMRPASSSNGSTAHCGRAIRDSSRDRSSSSTKTSSCQMRRVTV
jgi:hypothetical protein